MKKYFPALVALGAVVLVAATLRAPRNPSEYDVNAFGALPTLVNGRVKPLDTVARTSLLMMQGRQRVRVGELTLTPNEWLLDMLYRPAKADHYPVLEIVHPELLALLDVSTEQGAGGKRFSVHQIGGKIQELDRQAKLADGTEAGLRTPFQRAVVQLRDALMLYQRLQSSLIALGNEDFLDHLARLETVLPEAPAAMQGHGAGAAHDSPIAKLILTLGNSFSVMDAYSYLRPIPPAEQAADNTGWGTVGAAWTQALSTGKIAPAAHAYAALGRAWRDRQPEAFNNAVRELRADLARAFPEPMQKGAVETRFNSAQPFYTSSILYVAAFLLAVISWLKWPDALGRAAFGLVIVAFALTSLGIGVRMWLEARPPVTNLYSSALFVGWGAVGLCLILEYYFRNAVGSVAAGLIGFAALVIAHHLALGGDTLEMMRAVLDSNFWLATHVVTITVGYSAMFLAGFLGVIYVFRGLLTRSLDRATADGLGRMMYGVICFATFFCLVGTVLGGIWADQSWGRFWGWDPKENGALLIVIWCAIILHARWGGFVKQRGLAVLSICGNIVTAWSWFGVNMLGVGLHSYGFMDAAFWWLVLFVGSQLAVILAAAVPMERWRSFRTA